MIPHKNNSTQRRIAYFISPHGYGHAARAAAVMATIHELDAAIQFEIFTQVPRWFFEESLVGPFDYHSLLTDIGLVQKNSLVEDLPETIQRLNRFLPFDRQQIQYLADQINGFQPACRLIICDIAPMGIAVARAAGVPSVLVENFTWDWIYQGYITHNAQMGQHITYLRELFAAADYHLQAEPICRPGPVDLTTAPISRKVRTRPAQTRQRLGLTGRAKVVVLTMGGTGWDYSFLEQVESRKKFYFVIPGSSHQIKNGGNLITLPPNSGVFHPDLINASDAVIGKAGYSTLAEAHQAGIPFGYIARPAFRESPVLVAYIEAKMNGLPFTEAQFQNGRWLSKLPDLLALPRTGRAAANGADQIAAFIHDLLV